MAICRDYYNRSYYCRSNWDRWGRWVALVVIVVAAILFFFVCSCLATRRRRKAGRKPLYGTGWATNNRIGGAPPPQYQPQGQQQSYNQGWNSQPQQTGGYYGQNQGYYGGQATELQQPQNTYQNVYQPPTGPPPGK